MLTASASTVEGSRVLAGVAGVGLVALFVWLFIAWLRGREAIALGRLAHVVLAALGVFLAVCVCQVAWEVLIARPFGLPLLTFWQALPLVVVFVVGFALVVVALFFLLNRITTRVP
jgi:hypothetical protein